jgi:hypothetical protein
MPFTPAHSAIVLPLLKLHRRGISHSGLIIGTMAPDFEYFFKMRMSGVHGHSLPGIFYFDLPVATLLAFVFHLIVKERLIRNLPVILQARFQPLLNFDFIAYFKAHFIVFFACCILGAASHIFWDGFTHYHGFFVRYFSYRYSDVTILGTDVPLYRFFQHLSTIVGLSVITVFVLKIEPDRAVPVYQPSLRYWLMVIAITVIIVILRFIVYSSDLRLENFIVTSISGFCMALILAGFNKLRLNRQKLG